MADGSATPLLVPRPRTIAELNLPAARDVPDLRAWTRRNIEAENVKLAVIDDDPTGTQTVRGVPLITSWDEDEIEWAMLAAQPTFAVLTNTRAVGEDIAVAINREVGERLGHVARRHAIELRVISRSDSMLRGHFPGEPEALAAGLAHCGRATHCILVCPAYPEAGRVTADDVHWVQNGDRLTPVSTTEYARDPAFGYQSSDLTDWIRERAGASATVTSITLADVRRGGPSLVAERLLEACGSVRYVVANAMVTSDLDALALGIELAEQRGARLVYRSGPSFLSARAGAAPAKPLRSREIAMPNGRGLMVVGSHTSLTTAQLNRAAMSHQFEVVPLDVEAAISADPSRRAAGVGRAVGALRAALMRSDAALVTSRDSVHTEQGAASLLTSSAVADALVQTVRAVVGEASVDWLIAKGGITSHDIAVRALRVRRATVLGQLFFGKVSVWTLEQESLRPGLRYIVFPGNVGDEWSLARALDRLKGLA